MTLLIPPPTPLGHRSAPSEHCRKAVVGSSTLANFGKGSENQDTFIAATNNRGSKCFVGVFDGHGEKGKIISHLASNALSHNLFCHEELHANPTTAFESAYRATQDKLVQEHSIDA